MKSPQLFKTSAAVVILSVIVSGEMFIRYERVHAKDDDDDQETKIRIGFQIAPVHLNLAGKDRALVGLGSYLVNGANDCNACHNSGSAPDFEYTPGGNPYSNQRKVVNPATYLGGGQNFGPVGPPPSPDIVTRNLTPDKTGRPEGGHTFAEFRRIIRRGKDFDHLHPNCTATITTNCIPASTGIDGDLLQIMPWPYYQSMTDHDLLAIYTYLSAIPCIDTVVAGQPQLRNDCH
jgi:hypothetical protein